MMFKQTRNFNPAFINSISEDLTYHGNWWLPENPQDKVSGVLYLKKSNGIKLTLIGMFKNDSSNEIGFKLASHGIILGQLVPGSAPITLITCIETGREAPSPQNTITGAVQRFNIEAAIFGYNIPGVEDLKFKGFEFSTTYLMDWMDTKQFELTFNGNDAIVSTLPKKEIRVKGTDFEICLNSWGSTSFEGSHNTKQHSSISVAFDKEISIEDFQQKFQAPLLDLVQFGSSLLNSITFTETLPMGGQEWRKIYLTSEFEQIKRSSQPVIHYSLFRLSEFSDSVEPLILNWLKIHHEIKHIFRLYFDSMYIGFQFPVSRFLNIIQALESFHSEREKNDDIILRQRLKDMFSDAREVISEIDVDEEALISRAIDTRNYYTHYNSKKRIKAASGLELEALTYTLRIVLIFQFLLACELDNKKIVELIKKYLYFRDVKYLIKENNFWRKN